MLNTDPKLGLLADNGGPTLTHTLLPGSKALGTAGPNNFVFNDNLPECIYQDQTGKIRPKHGCDIGAVESDLDTYEGYYPLFRFWSLDKQSHFYTTNPEEKQIIITKDTTWQFENVGYYVGKINAAQNCVNSNQSKVFRFWNPTSQHHFYTANELEKNSLIEKNPSWNYEGIAFCADVKATTGLEPVYRFYSPSRNGHFFTINAAEKDKLISEDSSWIYEDIAYYAKP
jgi:hypothetical protein